MDADAMASRLSLYGFVCKVQDMDMRSRGMCKMTFTNFTTCTIYLLGSEYLEIIRNCRLKYTDHFDDLYFKGKINTTV